MNAEDTINKKFEKAKLLFDEGLIQEFKDLFDIIPYSVVARKLNTNNVRFKAKLEDPLNLKLGELRTISELLNVDAAALFSLAIRDKSVNKEPV
ncbi:hypothetical protein HUW51_00875 (plasmid) [Adhaeribacter swui]|uniref:XRE family transcriptional regulator n=1 Tax=Adhaeribacter swui TaxID=2086471 RepID=A0A7G7G2F7_9BACT|nr:hypothetical protein [Adhaeribacter swui]QNF31341.1 hypothetical protein HUW51_00875 [Adhaeribacter swui]